MALVKYNLNGNEVEYNDKEFKIRHRPRVKKDYLHYIGNGKNVTNPKGNTSCFAMFMDFKGPVLDLSKFDTSNVTDMSFMFCDCINLEHLNLSNFNTNNAKNLYKMFWNCENLKELDISSFNISKVKSLEYMFFGCYNLLKLDLSSFNFTGDKIINYMFWACPKLEELKIDKRFYQFFVDNYYLLFNNNKKTKIIPINKIGKIIQDLFY